MSDALPSSVHTLVVGAGAAGSVIASRVTEASGQQVLLIDAGPDYPDPALLPADLADGRRNSLRRHDWGFKHRPTVPQVRFSLPRGKVVGGSSAVNTCIGVRGQPEDFDEWAAMGLPEWSWDQCLPAFIRMERDLDFDTKWHGRTGPLPLKRPAVEDMAPWAQAFLQACSDLGYAPCADSNEPGAIGAGPHALNRIEGRRISAAEAWLTPDVRARDNLQVAGGVHALRVLFRGDRAVALEVQHRGEVRRIEATRIVLCAGAICTPELLLRSGVGPANELERLGVERVADVPGVGRRLLDHAGFAFFLRPRWGRSTPEAPIIEAALRYRVEGVDNPAGMQMQPGANLPLAHLNVPVFSLMAALGKPRGHGTIRWPHLRRGARPIIDSRFLEDDFDRALAVDAMTRAYALSQTPTLLALATPIFPRASVLKDPAKLDRAVRKICDSGYHPCGTVPMGPDDDPFAATDGRGRVRGTEGLHVADASLMPTIPSGNIHLPTLMIGERFGQWLREGM